MQYTSLSMLFGSLRMISNSPETRLVSISVRANSMHRTESRDISNRKYLSKTILACRERQAKNRLPNIDRSISVFFPNFVVFSMIDAVLTLVPILPASGQNKIRRNNGNLHFYTYFIHLISFRYLFHTYVVDILL